MGFYLCALSHCAKPPEIAGTLIITQMSILYKYLPFERKLVKDLISLIAKQTAHWAARDEAKSVLLHLGGILIL